MSTLHSAAFPLQAGREDEAMAALRHVAELAPRRAEAHDPIINVAIRLGRHGEAVTAGEALGVEFTHADFAAEPFYAPLIASSEYQRWRQAHAE